MKTFKTMKDLQQLSKTDPAYQVIKTGLKRTGHLEGYFVLIEEGDTTIDLPELQAEIRDLSFDGVFKVPGYYHAVYLTNNSFGLEFVIPDKKWLSVKVRDNLNDHVTI